MALLNAFGDAIDLSVDFLIACGKHADERRVGASIWQDGTRHHVIVGLENLCRLFISLAKSDELVKNVIPLVDGGFMIESP